MADQPVDGGRFTLALDFGAQFFGSERYLEMRVRPGASTGVYTPLLPRQAIRPTPEALRAASAPWSGIVGAPPGLDDGIDNTGITSLAAGAGLTTVPGSASAGAPVTTTGSLSLRAGGIEAAMIADGAVGLAQINTAQVQARLAAGCLEGDYLAGIAANGTPDCRPLLARVERVIDPSGDVGSEIGLALRSDDRPMIAYYYASSANLKLHACDNRACSSGATRTLDSAGDVGRAPAIAIGPDGRAVIAYHDTTNLALKLYACANESCSSGAARTLDDTRNVTTSIDVVFRPDGRPMVAYGDTSNLEMRVFDCADATCSGGVSRMVVGSMYNGSSVAIALGSDGLPVLARGGNGGAGQQIAIRRCADAGCVATSGASTTNQYANRVALVVRSNNRPLIAAATSAGYLRVLDCTSTDCSTFTVREIDPGPPEGISIALDDNMPVLSYRPAAPAGRLRVYRCVSSTCSDGSMRTIAGPDESVGRSAKIAIRSDGRPVIAHYDSLNGDLLLQICGNRDCL